MTGKIVVYGGSGGIGSESARLLQARGYNLHLAGRNREKLTSTAAELKASYTVGDVNDSSFFTQVVQEAGTPLAGLVYAVGTINLRSFQRLTEADFLNDFRVNALGAALAVQAALPGLKKHPAVSSIVLFSSVIVGQGFTFHGSMGMAKGAVSGLTLSLAAELAPRIRVNAIAPSLTRTPLAASIFANDAMAASIADLHALERLGTTADIAKLTAFLISEDADWITGQIIGVDGGRSTLRTSN